MTAAPQSYRESARSGILLAILSLSLIGCPLTAPNDAESLVSDLNVNLPAVIAGGNSPSIQLAVMHKDQIVWSRAFGENTSVDHIYMNASIQKVFTATAILQLVEKGLLDLDADIGDYLPFPVRHPDYPETPITVRLLLSHRSGLKDFPHQFDWDTESAFSPRYRPSCPEHLAAMSQEEFLIASLIPGGANDSRRTWVLEPDQHYSYSVSAFPLMRYLIGQVAGRSYAEYMRENVFTPLGMANSGFSADEFEGRHTIPYTRIDGENVGLPMWNGRGSMMHTTAGDMAKFLLALVNDGRYGDVQLLQPETIGLMQQKTSSFRGLFKGSDDLQRAGQGLGMNVFRGGWFGIGGSVPGYQGLLRYNPSKQVGYAILSNVNAILGGGHNYASARRDLYEVQNALVPILDPVYVVRRRAGEIWAVGGLVLYTLALGFWARRRKKRRRDAASD